MALGTLPTSSWVLPRSPLLLLVASGTFPVSSTVFPRPSGTRSFFHRRRACPTRRVSRAFARPRVRGTRYPHTAYAADVSPDDKPAHSDVYPRRSDLDTLTRDDIHRAGGHFAHRCAACELGRGSDERWAIALTP